VVNDFESKLAAKLAAFEAWARGRHLRRIRLVQYCGNVMIGAVSVAPQDALAQIRGLLSEGFHVDWSEHAGRVYLRVWEFDGPEPEWHKVYGEASLAELPPGS
jgi:hypothetical protein